jgi:ubiquitin C-terminal hydrolase
MFGGISVLLVGDFLQLPVVNGIDLYHVLYSAIKGDDVKAANLFSHFQVVELETQRRAADSLDHTRRLELFRALPIRYPLGPRWDALDSAYKPLLVDDLLEAVTKEITYNDVLEDETWITQSTILTTNNADHAVLNAERASIYARYFGRIVLKWRRVIRKELPLCLQELLYNSDKHPELFAYFVIGAPAQILDNGNGNVLLRVANGTMCTMYKLAWNNELDTQNASKAIREAVLSNKLIADVPTPDYIIVSIKRHPDYSWPTDLDLSPTNPEVFTIPIGLDSRQEKNHLCIASSRIKVHYIAHAVDLAFAITVWKSQGGEYDKIVLLLEPSKPGPALNYHLLYTAFSRVKLASGYRCLPITSSKVRIALGQLRPNIYSVKYRMSISEKGYWYKHKRDKSAPKCSKQSKVLKAKIANNSIVSVNRYCDDNFQSNTRIPSLTTDVRNIRNSKRKHCATVTCNNMDSVPTRKDTRSGLSLQMDTVSINEENIMYASTRSLNAHLVTNSPDDEHNPQIEEILYENEINRTKLASTLVSFEMDSVSMNEENMAHVSNQVETIGRTLNGAIVSNSPKNESDLQINQILYDNHINSVIQASLPFQRVAVIGFSNVGNSCYINAIVQMFNLVVLSIPDTDVQNSNRTPIADTFMNLINTLRKTVSIFWDRQEQLCKQLIQLLGFSQEQQDAHEAAIKLVELLPTMFLHQFGFTTEYTLECSCNHISVQKCKNESILPIQIIYRIHETVPSLRTLLTHYLQPERLTDYICGQCSRLGTTIKSVKIANGKMFISFQLVRFYTSEEGITKKYCGKVIVSKYILINHVTYKLVAAILHHGDSMEDGHYTTIICDTKMHYNDGRISKISNIDDKIANNSYILLFQKINS